MGDGDPPKDRWRAVVIEDHASLLSLYRAMMEDSRIDIVDEAMTAAQGLAAVRRQRPDLVILDLGLPDRDGLEILPTVAAMGCIVAVVTAFRGGSVEHQARRRGARACIEKGGSPLDLVAKLEALMAQGEQHLAPEPVP